MGLAPQTSEAVKTMENRPVCRKKWVRRREVTPPRLSAISLAPRPSRVTRAPPRQRSTFCEGWAFWLVAQASHAPLPDVDMDRSAGFELAEQLARSLFVFSPCSALMWVAGEHFQHTRFSIPANASGPQECGRTDHQPDPSVGWRHFACELPALTP